MKVASYIKETLARLSGNTDKVIAERNYRFSTSALELKISEEKHKLNKLQREVEKAKEALETAKYPTYELSNEDSYLSSLRNAQNSLTQAEDNVSQNQENTKFLQTVLDDYNNQVEEAPKA